EQSLAQLLNIAGVASIHFMALTTPEDLGKLQRALMLSGRKPGELAEAFKTAFNGSSSVRVNQVRFVATSEHAASALATQLASASLSSSDASQVQDWLSDPHKLLQAIAAVEGSRQTAQTAAPGTPTPVTGTLAPITGESSVAGLEEQELALAFRMLGQ